MTKVNSKKLIRAANRMWRLKFKLYFGLLIWFLDEYDVDARDDVSDYEKGTDFQVDGNQFQFNIGEEHIMQKHDQCPSEGHNQWETVIRRECIIPPQQVATVPGKA